MVNVVSMGISTGEAHCISNAMIVMIIYMLDIEILQQNYKETVKKFMVQLGTLLVRGFTILW
jgi:hypothetical protein